MMVWIELMSSSGYYKQYVQMRPSPTIAGNTNAIRPVP